MTEFASLLSIRFKLNAFCLEDRKYKVVEKLYVININ